MQFRRREVHVQDRRRVGRGEETVRRKIPPEWRLTLILAGVAVGLLAVLLVELRWRSGIFELVCAHRTGLHIASIIREGSCDWPSR
jgi:hypothetical protein